MTDYKLIQSKDNQLIKRIIRLAQNSKHRQIDGLTVAYGEHLVQEAQHYGLIEQIIVCANKVQTYTQLLAKLPAQQINLVTPEIMSKLNILESDVTILALVRCRQPVMPATAYHTTSIVLEQIQDPGNLGTVLRAAAASGIKQVVLSPGSVEVNNPKVLRAAQGMQWGLDIYSNVEVASFLAKYHGPKVALVPVAEQSLYQLDLTQTIAFVLGNEGSGLTLATRSACDCEVSIPMPGKTESLNLAMAATIAMFEMARQRLGR